MIQDLSPILHKANVSLKPEELLLEKGSWVKFSSLYPNSGDTQWASGKTFVVDADPMYMPVPWSDIIANQDWVNLDISNKIGFPPSPGVPHPTAAQNFSKQMYPVNSNVMYQVGIGLKKGSYFVQLYIPFGGNPIYQLGSSAIVASINDPVYKYFGARYPKDSPVDGPTWFLYLIQSDTQVVIQKFMDGGDTMDLATGVLYGKATVELMLNKCHLQEITSQSTAVVNKALVGTTTVPSGCVAVVTGASDGGTQIVQSGAAASVPSGQTTLAYPGDVVQIGSGSAYLTTMNDINRWRTIQERALYVPYYTELSGL